MQNILDYIDQNSTRFQEELFDLLRIPSISADSKFKSELHKAAKILENKLKSIGLDDVTLHETPGNPILTANWLHAGDDKPTVLIYGHYDVQPPDPEELWETEPFEPTIRDGKVYARGASDDKGQAYIHIASVESCLKADGSLPVNIKFILEGEEEIGSPNLVPFLTENKDLLACDMVLISDTAMFGKDTPSITYGLRGLAYMEMHVTGPNRDLHSGAYGNGVQNPVNALAQIIAKMRDENGVVQIPGFYDNVRDLTSEERAAYAELPFDEQEYKDELDIDEVFGEEGFSTLERVSARPSLDVNGIWGGYQGEGAKTVLPSKAGAKVSMRLVPDQTPEEIYKKFKDFVASVTPPGVTVKVEEHHGGYPAMVDLNYYGLKSASKAFETVYGKKALMSREGGSIPIVADFAKVLHANSILMGFGLRTDAIHSPNEHFSLEDFHRGMKTSAAFFHYLEEFKE